MLRHARAAAAVITFATAALIGGGSTAAAAAPSLSDQVAALKVAAEHRAGYDRDAFGDYDRDALLAANFAAWPSCDGYYSRYDGKCWTDASDVDVDHTVALGEAWDSGAWKWTSSQRDAFAADTKGAGNLALMTDNLNQSKGDDDVTGWLPPRASQTCHFVGVVVHVKAAYGLSVDSAEKAKLADLAKGCDGTTQTGGGGDQKPPAEGGGTTPTNDVDCSDFDTQQAAQAVFDQHDTDVFDLDRDGDGKACDSLPSGSGTSGTSTGRQSNGTSSGEAPAPTPVTGDFSVTG